VKGGEDVIMADVVLLLTFAIVLTAVKTIIDDIKKKGSIINVGVTTNGVLIKFCVGDGFQTSQNLATRCRFS